MSLKLPFATLEVLESVATRSTDWQFQPMTSYEYSRLQLQAACKVARRQEFRGAGADLRERLRADQEQESLRGMQMHVCILSSRG
jgi:hypothetical protein